MTKELKTDKNNSTGVFEPAQMNTVYLYYIFVMEVLNRGNLEVDCKCL